MNAIAEPIELLEAECCAQGWYEPVQEAPMDEDELVTDVARSERVLDWTVERICACPSYCRDGQS